MIPYLVGRSFCITGSKLLKISQLNLVQSQIFKISSGLSLVKKENYAFKTNSKIYKAIEEKTFSTDIKENSHDHVMHWNAERIFSLALLGTIPSSVLISSPGMEYILALTLTVHAHWGIEAIVCDYIRPSIFGKVLPRLAIAIVYGLSAVTLGGLLYFIYTDVGIVNGIRLLWKL